MADAKVKAILSLPVSSLERELSLLVTAASSSNGAAAVATFTALVTALMDIDAVLPSVGRPVMTALINVLRQSDEAFGDANSKNVLEAFVSRCTGRAFAAYGDEVVSAREILADIAQESGRLQEALSILAAIPTDPGLRSAAEAYKFFLWVRMGELCLQMDMDSKAEGHLTRAWPLLKYASDEDIAHRFHYAFATVLDLNRKFLDAALRFYTLSQSIKEGFQPSLQRAVTCLLLADAGPQRSRLLAAVEKDERIAAVGEIGTILKKVAHQRVLREKDVVVMHPFLQPHHNAIGKFNRTVFDNAIAQHNLLSASQIYYNISFQELGALLGVASSEAERIAAQMIMEDRLKATIDQIAETITFLAAAGETVPLQLWDAQISAVCQGASSVADAICRQHPQFLPLLDT